MRGAVLCDVVTASAALELGATGGREVDAAGAPVEDEDDGPEDEAIREGATLVAGGAEVPEGAPATAVDGLATGPRAPSPSLSAPRTGRCAGLGCDDGGGGGGRRRLAIVSKRGGAIATREVQVIHDTLEALVMLPALARPLADATLCDRCASRDILLKVEVRADPKGVGGIVRIAHASNGRN